MTDPTQQDEALVETVAKAAFACGGCHYHPGDNGKYQECRKLYDAARAALLSRLSELRERAEVAERERDDLRDMLKETLLVPDGEFADQGLWRDAKPGWLVQNLRRFARNNPNGLTGVTPGGLMAMANYIESIERAAASPVGETEASK